VIRVVLSILIFDQVVGLYISIRNFPKRVVSLRIIATLNITGPSARILNEGTRSGFFRYIAFSGSQPDFMQTFIEIDISPSKKIHTSHFRRGYTRTLETFKFDFENEIINPGE